MDYILNLSSDEFLSPTLKKEIENHTIAMVEKLGLQDYEAQDIRLNLEEFFSEISKKWFRDHPHGIKTIIEKIIEISDLTKPGRHVPYEIIFNLMFEDPEECANLLISGAENEEIINNFEFDISSLNEDYSDGNWET